MSEPELRVATADDADHMAAVLADAFHDDPIFTWLFPDAASRPRLSQAMFAMLGRHPLEIGQDLGLVGVGLAPPRIRRERIRVQM